MSLNPADPARDDPKASPAARHHATRSWRKAVNRANKKPKIVRDRLKLKLMPVLPARLAAAPLPQRPRPLRQLTQPFTRRRFRGVPRVLPQPRLKLSDPLAGLRQLRPCLLQRGQRIRQFTAQRCHQPGQHLIRRPLFITGHTGTLPPANAHRAHFPSPARTSFTMHGNTRQTDGTAAFARLLPRGDSIFPGPARHAILDPLRHR